MRNNDIATQAVKFCIVGCINTLITLIIYNLCVWFGFHPIIGILAGYGCGIISSWNLNASWTFSKENKKGRIYFIKFLLIAICIIIISMLLTFILYNIFGMNKHLIPFLVLLITVPTNFLLNKYFVFTSSFLKCLFVKGVHDGL